MNLQVNDAFADVLKMLSRGSPDFFLAASLYHAREVSFAAAAELAGMDVLTFGAKLSEHFGRGFLIADEDVLEDLTTVRNL